MNRPPRFWDGVVRRLESRLSTLALEAWVRPLAARQEGEGVAVLCPTPFHRERVRQRFLEPLRVALHEELGREVEVELVVAPRVVVAARTPARSQRDQPPRVADARRAAPRPAAPHPKPVQPSLLQTFESFVVGPANALAREASLALARGRQRGASPLFLAAAPGLGKTHLARAVVHEARVAGAERVLYEPAEAFTNRFMSSIRKREMERFKARYRGRCELLVLEDVQFVAAKAATQLELFHTLCHLMDCGARVVVTGDRLPRDIEGLEARLCSQLTAGLVAEIEPPDAALRRRILRAKAAAGGVRIPDACLDLLVEGVRGSVRDLEGALIQLVSSASLLKRPVDLDLTSAALRKLGPLLAPPRRLPIQTVVRAVASFFGTSPEALASRSRRRDVLVPRQLAMYLCRRYTEETLSSIARAFGRDHPAVANAVKTVERRILERAPLRYQVEELASRLERIRASGG